jgi:hypothetical protein
MRGIVTWLFSPPLTTNLKKSVSFEAALSPLCFFVVLPISNNARVFVNDGTALTFASARFKCPEDPSATALCVKG